MLGVEKKIERLNVSIVSHSLVGCVNNAARQKPGWAQPDQYPSGQHQWRQINGSLRNSPVDYKLRTVE
jgi:hypothetical protein